MAVACKPGVEAVGEGAQAGVSGPAVECRAACCGPGGVQCIEPAQQLAIGIACGHGGIQRFDGEAGRGRVEARRADIDELQALLRVTRLQGPHFVGAERAAAIEIQGQRGCACSFRRQTLRCGGRRIL